jgi:hypothetical protein
MNTEIEYLKNQLKEYQEREARLKELIGKLASVTSWDNYSGDAIDEDEGEETWKIGEVYYNLADLVECDLADARTTLEEADFDADEILGSQEEIVSTLKDYICPILNELNYLIED